MFFFIYLLLLSTFQAHLIIYLNAFDFYYFFYIRQSELDIKKSHDIFLIVKLI